MDLEVREATVDDLAMLQELGTELMLSDRRFDPLLEKEWYFNDEGREYLLKCIREDDRVCLVAEIEGKLIGYATGGVLGVESWRPIKRAELYNLLVTSKLRSHGAGHKLVAAFKEWGKNKGASRFKVLSYALNKDAIRFYEDNGFKPQLISFEADS